MVNAAQLQELEDKLRQECDDKINVIKISFEAKVEELHKILERKDDTIGQLNQEIGKLKECCNFLTQETTDIKKLIGENKQGIDDSNNTLNEVKDKTVDLEDRSRRNNLVFYNIPEPENKGKERENCEKIIAEELHKCGIDLTRDLALIFDRAHRLGKPHKARQANRPRPIIARFTYYREKEDVLRMKKNLKDSDMNISEDYSKTTLDIHRKLVSNAKDAKEKLSTIKSFRITYRRVTLRYELSAAQNSFFKSFNLKDIEDNNQWFMPN